MAGRPRKSQSDDSVLMKDASDAQNLDVERKDKFLKRINKEDKANKKNYKKEDRYIEVIGKKVLEKFKNKVGSGYTRFWFNAKRHPAALEKIKRNGGHTFEENGKSKFVPLKYIDGRPFIKKD